MTARRLVRRRKRERNIADVDRSSHRVQIRSPPVYCSAVLARAAAGYNNRGPWATVRLGNFRGWRFIFVAQLRRGSLKYVQGKPGGGAGSHRAVGQCHLQPHPMAQGSLSQSHMPYDRRDLDKEAHRHCLFGQWYYQHAAPKLREHAAFESIESVHRVMHEVAAGLFFQLESGGAVAAQDYEQFDNLRDRLILQMESLKREMENLLLTQDPLTGAFNRIEIFTHLREQQALVHRGVQACCIAMIDLDHFKTVNDTFGHILGDKTLQATAQYLISHLRPYDRLFRYGREEFLLCLPDTDLNAGRTLVERPRCGLADMVITAEAGKPFGITASFGIAALDPALPVEDSVNHADKALYTAKTAGRNRTETMAT